jgi:hypothetical protein
VNSKTANPFRDKRLQAVNVAPLGRQQHLIFRVSVFNLARAEDSDLRHCGVNEPLGRCSPTLLRVRMVREPRSRHQLRREETRRRRIAALSTGKRDAAATNAAFARPVREVAACDSTALLGRNAASKKQAMCGSGQKTRHSIAPGLLMTRSAAVQQREASMPHLVMVSVA